LTLFWNTGKKSNMYLCPGGLVCSSGLAHSILSLYGDCCELRTQYITLCNIPKKLRRGIFPALAETQGICAKG